MSSEVEETLKRLIAHKGVIGTIVVNNDGIPIKSTLDNHTTTQYAGLINQLVDQVYFGSLIQFCTSEMRYWTDVIFDAVSACLLLPDLSTCYCDLQSNALAIHVILFSLETNSTVNPYATESNSYDSIFP